MKKTAICMSALFLAIAAIFIFLPKYTQATETNNLYLPVVEKRGAPFGVQIDVPVSYGITSSMIAPWGYYQYPARWMCIEPIGPVNGVHTYNWDNSLSGTAGGDAEAECVSEHREPASDWIAQNAELLKEAHTIVGVKTSPEWARVFTDHIGSPPKPEFYDDYALMVNAVISKTNPWGVEIWNEPDTDCDLNGDNGMQYGCFHDGGNVTVTSVRTAGCTYGRLLSVVYPIIKAEYPNVEVIAGALMNYGDPNGKWAPNFMLGAFNTQDNTGYGEDCGYGDDKADLVSLHQYRDWRPTIPPGGIKPGVEGYNQIVDTLARAYALYDEVGKPVIISEAAMRDPRDGYGANTEPNLLEYQYEYYKFLVRQWEENKWNHKVVLVQNYGLKYIGWQATDLIVGNLFKPSFDLIMWQLAKPRITPYGTPSPIPTWTSTPASPEPITTLELVPYPDQGEGMMMYNSNGFEIEIETTPNPYP